MPAHTLNQLYGMRSGQCQLPLRSLLAPSLLAACHRRDEQRDPPAPPGGLLSISLSAVSLSGRRGRLAPLLQALQAVESGFIRSSSTECVKRVATRVIAKIYRPFF